MFQKHRSQEVGRGREEGSWRKSSNLQVRGTEGSPEQRPLWPMTDNARCFPTVAALSLPWNDVAKLELHRREPFTSVFELYI